MDNLASPHTPLSIERMVSPKGKGGIQPLQKYGGRGGGLFGTWWGGVRSVTRPSSLSWPRAGGIRNLMPRDLSHDEAGRRERTGRLEAEAGAEAGAAGVAT